MLLLYPPNPSVASQEAIKRPSLSSVMDPSSCCDLGSVILQHSPQCPLWKLLESRNSHLFPQHDGVYVGVAIVVESSDSYILLTQRSDHMRAFPRAWVPPGGHLEFGEDLIDGGLRELEEETGLKFDSSNSDSKLLCLWESVYPVLLGIGEPKNHHVVVYIHLKSSESWEQLQSKIKLDPQEVQACTWLSGSDVRRLFGNEEDRKWIVKKYLSESDGLVTKSLDLNLSKMFHPLLWQDNNFYSGTQMALARWLACDRTSLGEQIPCKI